MASSSPSAMVLIKYARITNWRTLGVLLGLDPVKLDAIDKANKDESEKLLAMYQRWIATNLNATYNDVIEALESEPLEETVVAHKLKEFLRKGSTSAQNSTTTGTASTQVEGNVTDNISSTGTIIEKTASTNTGAVDFKEGHNMEDAARKSASLAVPPPYPEKFCLYNYPTSSLAERGHGIERGIAFIINNVEFNSENVNNRDSSDQDALRLKQTFENLGYKVITKRNRSTKVMKKELSTVARHEIKKDHDSFVCCILSHGNGKGIIGVDHDVDGVEDVILDSELTEEVNGENCQQLFGKPKTFFSQACRGRVMSKSIDATATDSTELVADGSSDSSLPEEADFFVSYSTSQDKRAFRDENNGSYYITTLCDVIDQCKAELSLDELLLVVHDKVAAHKFTYKGKVYRQMPEFRSTLRGKFKFC